METASTSNGTRYYVMAVTPTRMYSFTGIGSLDVSSYLISILHGWIPKIGRLLCKEYIQFVQCGSDA